ncbi:MFS transporter [Streptomyces sp. NPDC059627]
MSSIAMVMVVELVALSYTMTSTALPSITRHFRTDHGGWLLTCYMLTGAVVSPLLGKPADLYGKRRVLLGGLTAATAGFASVVPVIMFAIMAGSSTVSAAGVRYGEPGIRGALLLMAGLALGGALLAVTVLAPRRHTTASAPVATVRTTLAEGPADA